MKEVSFTGGARVGIMNASLPLARLFVEDGHLHCNVFLLGKHVFRAKDITALTLVGPLIGITRGVKIEHTKSDYATTIVFWTLGDAVSIIKSIEASSLNLREDQVRTELQVLKPALLSKETNPFKPAALFAVGATFVAIVISGILELGENGENAHFLMRRLLYAQSFLIAVLAGVLFLPSFRAMLFTEDADLAPHRKTIYSIFILLCLAALGMFLVGGVMSNR